MWLKYTIIFTILIKKTPYQIIYKNKSKFIYELPDVIILHWITQVVSESNTIEKYISQIEQIWLKVYFFIIMDEWMKNWKILLILIEF
jgi:hypothetical protein